jgi:excinuclease ABC subunit C
VSRETYGGLVEDVMMFLSARYGALESLLERRMWRACETQEFERAARYRDQLAAVRRALSGDSPRRGHRDVVAMHRSRDGVTLCVVSYGHGPRQKTRELHFGAQVGSDTELLAAFLVQYYSSAPTIPREIVVPFEVAHGVAVASILSERSPVRIAVASEGPDTSVVAAASLRAVRAAGQSAVHQERVAERLRDLADLLGLVRPPRRIECFDVSNLHAHCVVVGMVVFIDGKPHPKCWRSFQMEREAPDDCACLAEALRARMRTAEGSEPDLIVIDGGRGQLNAVRDMMTRTPAAPRLVAIAKAREGKPERLFVPERSEALIPVVGSPGLALLQQVRDAAHEHALAAHRGMRRRQGMRGSLEDVPGVGAKRRRSLLRHFGSLERIRERTAGEIASVHGISPAVAQQIVAHLRAM